MEGVAGALAELAGVVDARAPNGAPLYSDEELGAALPVLALSVARALPDLVLPDPVLDAIGAFCTAAGVNDDDDAETLAEKISAHIDAMTTGRAFLDALMAAFDAGAQRSGEAMAQAGARLIGAARSTDALQQATRPPGTVPAGPGARFTALANTPKRTPER